MNDKFSFELSLDKIVPDVLIENRRAYIFFSLTNYSGRETNGGVVAHLYLGPPHYNPLESTHWGIKLGDGLTASGVVAITPPFAAKSLTLLLEYRESGIVVATKEISIQVAARFDIGLAGFVPIQIRSGGAQDQDTVHATLTVIPANKIGVALSASAAVSRGVKNSNVELPFLTDNGRDPPTIHNLDVVPGTEPQNTILFSYTVLNNGGGAINSDVLTILNEISDLGDAFASAWVPGDAMQLLNNRIHQFHQALFDGCDGLLAADRMALTGSQLVDWTTGTDNYREMRQYSGEQSPSYCSGKQSSYKIIFFVHRQTTPKPSEFLYVYPEFCTVKPGETVSFNTDPTGAGHIDQDVTWSVEGLGDIGKFQRPVAYPEYTAPADEDWRKIIIVRATHKDGRKGIAFVRVVTPVSTLGIAVKSPKF